MFKNLTQQKMKKKQTKKPTKKQQQNVAGSALHRKLLQHKPP